MNDDLKETLLSALIAIVAWSGSTVLLLNTDLISDPIEGLVGELGLLIVWFVLFPAVVGFVVIPTFEIRTVTFCLGVGLAYFSIVLYMSAVTRGELHPVIAASWLVPVATCLGAVVASVLSVGDRLDHQSGTD